MSASQYLPELYDLFRADTTKDVEWYTSLALRSGGPILELGSGTGRTLLPLARAGVEIYGIDNSPKMLAVLKRLREREPPAIAERIHILEGNISTFSLSLKFSMIQIPFRTFLHNLERDAQCNCLQACYNHLIPGGLLALDVFQPSISYMAESYGAFSGLWRFTDERLRPTGGKVLFFEMTQYQQNYQRLKSHHRYECYGLDGRLEETYLQVLELAWLYPGDLRELLTTTGFTDIQIYGDFGEIPLEEETEELVVQARRP